MLDSRIYKLLFHILLVYTTLSFSSANAAECITGENILNSKYLQLLEKGQPPCDEFVEAQIAYLNPLNFGPPVIKNQKMSLTDTMPFLDRR